MEDTYSVGQVSKTVGISNQTVRSWTVRFADYLSDLATPPEGDERRYTLDDISVLATVNHLRKQGVKIPDIIPMIERGDRVEAEVINIAPDAEKTPKTDDTTALATVDLLDRFIVRYEERIDQLEGQLTDASKDLAAANDARLKAEIEAAELRGKVEQLEKPSRWQFWKR